MTPETKRRLTRSEPDNRNTTGSCQARDGRRMRTWTPTAGSLVASLAVGLISTLAVPALAQEIADEASPIQFERCLQGPDSDSIGWNLLKGKVVILEFWATW